MQSDEAAVKDLPLDAPVVAVDIGGTYLRAAVCDAAGVHGQLRVLTPLRAPDVVPAIAELVRPLVSADTVAVGVSATGPVDVRTGALLDVPNAPGLSHLRLRDGLEERVGRPVLVERDTNAALLAECAVGAARGLRHVVYLTLSTGVGGAVLVDGRLLRGARGFAGELGHVVVQVGGPVCGCGRRGCLEAVASGSGLARAAEALAVAHPDSSFGRLRASRAATGGMPLAGSDVAALARPAGAVAGDPYAVALIDAAQAAFVSIVVDILNVLDPELVVVGGSIARAFPDWLTTAEAAACDSGLVSVTGRHFVAPAAVGEDAELVGAALVAADRSRRTSVGDQSAFKTL